MRAPFTWCCCDVKETATSLIDIILDIYCPVYSHTRIIDIEIFVC